MLWLVRLQLQSAHLQQKIPQHSLPSQPFQRYPPPATQNDPTHNCCENCPLFHRGRSPEVLRRGKENLLGCFVLARDGHPRVHTCSHTDGCSRDAFGHVTFSVSPFSSATPVLLAVTATPTCSAPFTNPFRKSSSIWGLGNGRYFLQVENSSSLCGRRRARDKCKNVF